MDHPLVPGTRRQPAGAFGLLVLTLGLPAGAVQAQPSGGPYGPVPRRYAVPKAAHVYYVAPDGRGEATGGSLAEPTTLEAAFERVVTGDAIVMRGGTYRTGGLLLNQVSILTIADHFRYRRNIASDHWMREAPGFGIHTAKTFLRRRYA